MQKNSPSPTYQEETKNELEEFKAFLGPIATRYSDAQLVRLRSDMHAAARLLLDLYLVKRNSGGKAS